MMNLLCKLGFHDWIPLDYNLNDIPIYKITSIRGCKKCHRKEIIVKSSKGIKKTYRRYVTLADLRQINLDNLLG